VCVISRCGECISIDFDVLIACSRRYVSFEDGSGCVLDAPGCTRLQRAQTIRVQIAVVGRHAAGGDFVSAARIDSEQKDWRGGTVPNAELGADVSYRMGLAIGAGSSIGINGYSFVMINYRAIRWQVHRHFCCKV
jgi:hypothetical protein